MVHFAEGETGERFLVCGEYNARNRLGGYTGYRGFLYDERVGSEDGELVTQPTDDFDKAAFIALSNVMCSEEN